MVTWSACPIKRSVSQVVKIGRLNFSTASEVQTPGVIAKLHQLVTLALNKLRGQSSTSKEPIDVDEASESEVDDEDLPLTKRVRAVKSPIHSAPKRQRRTQLSAPEPAVSTAAPSRHYAP